MTIAVKPDDARGDLTGSHVLWKIERSVPVVPSPLLYRDVLYTIKDGGILSAIDPASGAIHKQARVTGAIDSYYASPVAAGGNLYLASENGKVSVLRAGSDWELLAVHDFGEPIYATPALSNTRIYLRTASQLYCFGN